MFRVTGRRYIVVFKINMSNKFELISKEEVRDHSNLNWLEINAIERQPWLKHGRPHSPLIRGHTTNALLGGGLHDDFNFVHKDEISSPLKSLHSDPIR